jgi:hypothetical protein
MSTEQTEERNCAFQYAKITGEIFRDTKIVCDESELTLTEAKELWNKYFPDLAKHIKSGNTGEMALWINMPDSHSYGETLQHISTDAESNGIDIWETKKTYFSKQFKIESPCT